jgi:peptidoglycan/LPS O-acetylase OafA/YrhL
MVAVENKAQGGNAATRETASPGTSVPRATLRPVRFAESQASVLLDLVRGVAALAVLVEHWRNLFFVDYHTVAAHRWLWLLPYELSSAGHQAVVVFFVLSGYLVSGSIFRMMRRGRWSWKTYALHRLTRLWIVLLPGLLLTSLWDHAGMSLRRAPAIAMYAGFGGNHMVPDVHATSGVGVALGNLFFLQTLRFPVLGTNGALWSLAYEFWYYALFPLALIALRKQEGAAQRAIHAAFFVAAAYFVRHDILKLFLIWLMGTLLATVPVPRLGSLWRWSAAAIYVPFLYACARNPFAGDLVTDIILGAATLGFLWVLLSARSAAEESLLVTKAIRTLARLSFTLYVVHIPLLVLIGALVLGPARWQPNAPHVAEGFAILLAVLGFSWALAWATEFRTDAARRWLERRLGPLGVT